MAVYDMLSYMIFKHDTSIVNNQKNNRKNLIDKQNFTYEIFLIQIYSYCMQIPCLVVKSPRAIYQQYFYSFNTHTELV